MPTFHSNPINPSPLQNTLRRYPALFGIPLVLIIVGASFGLQPFTQTRYDLQAQKVKQVGRRHPSADARWSDVYVALPRRGPQT
jgi:cytochrome c oxidase assembly protein subunit 16